MTPDPWLRLRLREVVLFNETDAPFIYKKDKENKEISL